MSQPTPEQVLWRSPFSLFAGDWLNRAFERIGLRSRKGLHLAGRALVLVLLTWVPMAGLAIAQGLYSTRIDARNFFADYAAYGQFLIALPLFVVAERIVGRNTREAARDFLASGVIRARDVERVGPVHARIRELRLDRRAEYALVSVAFLLSAFTIGPEMLGMGPRLTWHTGSGGANIVLLPGGLTLAGAWALIVALPILNYVWLRLAWKVAIWTYYLYRMSRFHLQLVAWHPDLTGGIGFISEVQTKWALVIFAYGVSNVAAVIAYKVGIERAPLTLMPVWAPAVLFVVLAPSLFTIPLLMFTKQLFRAKRRALTRYREHARQHSVRFEGRWLRVRVADEAQLGDLAELNNLSIAFARIQQMRVVPFDLRSFGQLMGSTVGSIATALPILRLEGTLKDWLELVARLVGR